MNGRNRVPRPCALTRWHGRRSGVVDVFRQPRRTCRGCRVVAPLQSRSAVMLQRFRFGDSVTSLARSHAVGSPWRHSGSFSQENEAAEEEAGRKKRQDRHRPSSDGYVRHCRMSVSENNDPKRQPNQSIEENEQQSCVEHSRTLFWSFTMIRWFLTWGTSAAVREWVTPVPLWIPQYGQIWSDRSGAAARAPLIVANDKWPKAVFIRTRAGKPQNQRRQPAGPR